MSNITPLKHQNGRVITERGPKVDNMINDVSFPSTNDPRSANTLNSLRGDLGRTDTGCNMDISRVPSFASPSPSMKELKKDYHMKKKYYTKNIQSAIDSTQELHSGWLKARTTFKRWTKTWCQVKPGYLILYTSQEALKKHRLGVILLSVCQVIKRPTKKDGFCFKLINPFGCSVWAKSSTKAIVFAQASLTFRVSDESIGKLWLDALHRCHLSSNLEGYQPIIEGDDEVFARGSGANSRLDDTGDSTDDEGGQTGRQIDYMLNHSNNTSDNNSLSSLQRLSNNNNNYIHSKTNGRHVTNGITGKPTDHGTCNHPAETLAYRLSDQKSPASSNKQSVQSDTNQVRAEFEMSHSSKNPNSREAPNVNYSKMVAKFIKYNWKELQLENVKYLVDGVEELGSAGVQSEEVHESNKNFLWHIIKQLRPGMDLSKVTLPTFILEPRSFLEKLADYYYHCDILSEAVLLDDPVSRLINIVKWYLSGFYKKPKGPKKPYNPILGEKFRCFWEHPKTKSRTFFVAEQVSHHPPVSAFHVSNRKDGYTITCALLSRSKYGGNSVSAILDGKARLYLNERKETYTITMPYANCRGILLGSLCMELGGKVEIECLETDCRCELDFKLASMWANQSSYNMLSGKILKDNKVTHTLEGHWDKKITIVDKSNEIKSTLWEVTEVVRNSRLKRYTVSLDDQDARESIKLWSKVTEALNSGNQVVATAEKTRLEDMQRKEARERQGPFIPKHFKQLSSAHNDWTYKWQDDRCWDARRDIMQFEDDFKIKTLMLSPTASATGQTLPITDNDLPLTQLNKFAAQIQGLAESSISHSSSSKPGDAATSKQSLMSTEDLNEETVRTIESRIAAGNLLFERALKQVNEKNRKLENDIAALKRARGKRTMALLMTAVIIAFMSAIYKFLT